MRPPVSVVVPFAGALAAAHETVAALGAMRLRPGDEVLLADNTPSGAAREATEGTGVRHVGAAGPASSYYARNVGAQAAGNDWLLFVDADCRPEPGLLDAFFAAPVPGEWGAVAGGVRPAAGDDGLVARYAEDRRHLDQALNLANAYRPMAVTANLLVRREAWRGVGGFLEGMRSGGDSDFCWRLQDAGWELGLREAAVVEHLPRTTLRGLVRQLARYAAGRAWLARRHRGVPRPNPVREVVRCTAAAGRWALRGDLERARFAALDVAAALAEGAGALMPNVAAAPAAPARVAILTDQFPELSQTFVTSEIRALQRLGHGVRVEAAARASRPDPAAGRGIDAVYIEDDGVLRQLGALARLAAAHPLGCVRDLRDQRRWRREEHVRPLRTLAPIAERLRASRAEHLHAHFAMASGLDALRLGSLLGLPYSVTAHAYDIFQTPANLAEKLDGAAFATSGCDYNVRHLRALTTGRVERIVMGVDAERFRRTTPPPGGRVVLAVGRLVEKKGFADLVRAAALLRDREAADRVLIVGDGPLRGELEALVASLGLAGFVELGGPRSHDEVRELLERVDLLAMPCVVAADGDRDSMPVVVKEALAMEVPVVGTDEVGLPEVLREPWGVLVAPGDPAALAAGIEDLLARSPEERAEAGRAGRAFVLETADVDRETAALAALIPSAIRTQ